jgi:hypothetical protein
MPAVPNPQLGKDLTSYTVQGYSNSGGTLTLTGSAISIKAIHQSHSLQYKNTLSEINSSSSTRRNMVKIDGGFTMDISVFLVNDGTDPSPLETLANSVDYVKVAWVTGNVTGSVETHAFNGIIEGFSRESSGRDARICNFSLAEIDLGTSAYTRTVA